MKKTLLASAITLSVGGATTVKAATITMTSINFLGPALVAGTFNDGAMNGQMGSSAPFFGYHWTADQQNWFDTHSSTVTWAETGATSLNPNNAYDDFSYTFHLTGNQVAVGTYFDWNGSDNIPILTIYTQTSGVEGAAGPNAWTGNSLAMQTLPFPGQAPQFLGTSNDAIPVSGAVPVPAAIWLMGSGLIGLVGFARRRKA